MEAPSSGKDDKQAKPAAEIDGAAMSRIGYGLYVLTAREGDKDNGCIINTLSQLTSRPNRISVTVNKSNYTHGMIVRTGLFNVSLLTQETPMRVFEHFGFQSGASCNKFETCEQENRSQNGLLYIPKFTNAWMSGRVLSTIDLGTHTLFIAEVSQARVLSDVPSLTYDYYQQHIKPKPAPSNGKKGFRCKVCGYVYEGKRCRRILSVPSASMAYRILSRLAERLFGQKACVENKCFPLHREAPLGPPGAFSFG